MATKSRLPLSAVKAIEASIDALYDAAKARVLGPWSVDKKLTAMDYSQPLSLPGLFTAASSEEYTKPDEQVLSSLMRGVEGYIDSYRAATKVKVVKAVAAFLQQAQISGVDTDLATVLDGELATVWGSTTREMHRMIDTEAQNVRNTGALDGILKVNTSHGIEDPVVFFIIVRDSHVCPECVRLHMLEDKTTPRLWYLSEVGAGYHKKGEDNPKLGGLHPHCFVAGSRLHTGRGLVKIEELYQTQESVEVEVDKRVLNRRGGNNQFGAEIPGSVWFHRHKQGTRLLPASSVYDTGVQPCYRIELETGHVLELSGGHEQWVDDDEKGIKVEVAKLKVGDKIPLLSGEGSFGTDDFPDLAELMGNLMGDGTIGDSTASWRFFGDDIEYGLVLKEKAREFSSRLLDGMTVNSPDEKYDVPSTVFNSMVLRRIFVEQFGLSKKPRRVPERLWGATRRTVAAFLRGLYAADGHSEDAPSVVLAQNELEFLREIQLLLGMLGLVASIRPHGEEQDKDIEYADGRVFETHRKACWRLLLGGIDQVKKFYTDVGLGVPRKQEELRVRLEAVVGKVLHGRWRTSRVKSIEFLGDRQTYCLTEPMTNTVSANGIVTGNCRCALVTLMPGYGFNAGGKIAYKEKGFDAIAEQRSLKKAEKLLIPVNQ